MILNPLSDYGYRFSSAYFVCYRIVAKRKKILCFKVKPKPDEEKVLALI